MFDMERLAAPFSDGAAPAEFACSWSNGRKDAACVHLTGELDLSSAPELERTLQQAQGRAPVVVLDLRELTFIDSSGLHVIVNANARAERAHGRLILIRGARQLDRLFTMTGLDKLWRSSTSIPRTRPPTQSHGSPPEIPLNEHTHGTTMSAGAGRPSPRVSATSQSKA